MTRPDPLAAESASSKVDLRALLRRLTSREPTVQETKVLIVDDNPEMHLLLQAMLPDDLGTLFMARDGTEALTLARNEHPDVILLDLMLPGISGFEVLKELQADTNTADIPVIVLTAKDVTTTERELLEEHIQGLMNKTTLTPQSLLSQLRQLEALRR